MDDSSGKIFWLVGADGRSYGPADVALLNQWFQQGRAKGGSIIRNSTTGEQILLSQIPGFLGEPPAVYALPPQSATSLPYDPFRVGGRTSYYFWRTVILSAGALLVTLEGPVFSIVILLFAIYFCFRSIKNKDQLSWVAVAAVMVVAGVAVGAALLGFHGLAARTH